MTGKPRKMRVRLKGVNTSKKRLADGSTVTYYYAWRGGPRIDGEPGTPEFMGLYNEALQTRKRPPQGILFTLVAEYKASADYNGLSAPSKRAYSYYLKLIEGEFGDMPIEALSERGARAEFKHWRDSMSATPRKADYAWATLAKVMSFALDRERIQINPCKDGGRLYEADRKDKLWGEDEIGRVLSLANPEIEIALLMALWTGQRQGDLLALPWSAYDGKFIRFRQSKSGRKGKKGKAVKVPVGGPLRVALNAAPKRSPIILTNTKGRAWTSDGFRTSWGKLVGRAKIEDLTFHDLRGSAVTRLAVAGCTVPEIASITGHSLKDVEAILDAHYLGRDVRLAENAIRKLERFAKRS